MHFRLIDSIRELRPSDKIVASKVVSLAEDYLQDHFPLFPVMPGVLMLEAMYQASAWLVRVTDDFRHSLVLLKEARNIRYADFVRPGELLLLTATVQKTDGNRTWLKAEGTVRDQVIVSARLVLESMNLENPDGTDGTNEFTRQSMRADYRQLISQPRVAAAKASG